MPGDTKPAPSSPERILAAATELFALHGYEGVSTRQIAAQTGLNVSTIHHHVGSKRDLYLAVIERLYAQEERLVDEILVEVDDAVITDPTLFRRALFGLIDRFVEFARRNPSRQRLYVRRWLDATDELRQREAELTLRLYRRLGNVLGRGQALGVVRRDLDTGYFVRSVDWMIFCYFTAGAFSWRRLRGNPASRTNLERFKAYLRDYTNQMLEI